MTDLKLLDELLLDYMRAKNLQPADLEAGGREATSTTIAAMRRLRKAYASGEMPTITLTWARYFGHVRGSAGGTRGGAEAGGGEG